MCARMLAFSSILTARLGVRLASSLSVAGGNKNVSLRPFKEMPTEKGNSLLFGVSPQLMKDDFNLFNFYRDLTKKHGKVFRLKVSPRKYIVVVANAEYADFVRRQEGKYPERGDQLRALEYIQEEIDSATKALGNRCVCCKQNTVVPLLKDHP